MSYGSPTDHASERQEHAKNLPQTQAQNPHVFVALPKQTCYFETSLTRLLERMSWLSQLLAARTQLRRVLAGQACRCLTSRKAGVRSNVHSIVQTSPQANIWVSLNELHKNKSSSPPLLKVVVHGKSFLAGQSFQFFGSSLRSQELVFSETLSTSVWLTQLSNDVRSELPLQPFSSISSGVTKVTQ